MRPPGRVVTSMSDRAFPDRADGVALASPAPRSRGAERDRVRARRMGGAVAWPSGSRSPAGRPRRCWRGTLAPSGSGWRGSTCRARRSTTSAAGAGRSPTRTCAAAGRSRCTRPSTRASRARPRCRRPGGRSRRAVLARLAERGVGFATLTLHTGVASLEDARAAVRGAVRRAGRDGRGGRGARARTGAGSSRSARRSCGRSKARSTGAAGSSPGAAGPIWS